MRGIRNIATGLLLVAALVLLGGSAAAQIEGTCIYNETTGEIEYGISGGGSGNTYTVTMNVQGCVGLDGTPANLVGPTDNQTIGLICNASGGFGSVHVEICEGAICFATFTLEFTCDGSCTIREVAGAVPSSSGPALAILILILIGSGVWLARRRLA